HITNMEFTRAVRFEHEMLPVAADGFRVGQFGKMNARMRHLRGEGFVAKVQADAIWGRSADDARQQGRSVNKFEIGKIGRVAPIPEHARAGAALDVAATRVKWKSRRAARDHT